MEDIIRIKCPFDGAILGVKNVPGIENKSVRCPACNNKYPFSAFKRVSPAVNHGGGAAEREEGTLINDNLKGEDFTLGVLTVVGTDKQFTLNPGKNIIGRKGKKSSANFQIDTGEKRSMSREHLVVEVKKVPGKGYVHYLSLFKDHVNPTFIGKEPLLFGDCVILKEGDIIQLPDASLSFTLPDEEGTIY